MTRRTPTTREGARQGTLDEAQGATVEGLLAAGLLGTTGRLSGQQMLNAVKSWMHEGTVVLSQRDESTGVGIVRGAAILLLQDGEVALRHMLGRFAGLASTGLCVHAQPHARANQPSLSAYAEASPLVVLRALPLLVPPQTLVPGATDLKALLPKLRSASWSGALIGEHETTVAAAVVVEGRVAVARASRGGGVLERLDALRALQRIAFEMTGASLALVPLDGRTAAALAGFASELRYSGDPEDHTGVRAAAHGFAFVSRGEAYLVVSGGPAGGAREGVVGGAAAGAAAAGGPAAGDEPETELAFDVLEGPAIPDLHLPDEPPGWETQRYVLTLRGRDAMNPMTDLWMRFRSTYGEPGQGLLEVIAEGATLEHVSAVLETDLDELRPLLKKLEDEGLVRVGTTERR